MNFGIKSDLRRLLYSSIIVPKIAYAIPITLPFVNKKNIYFINKIHKTFSNLIIRAFKSTPLNISIFLSKLPDIWFSLSRLHNKIIEKHSSLGSFIHPPAYWPDYTKSNRRLKQIYPSISLLQHFFPLTPITYSHKL